MKKPQVGIVGEILVKYHRMPNNNLVELIESEGSEADLSWALSISSNTVS